jgi:hypothetical protein
MDKIKNLQEKAEQLRAILQKFAPTSVDVREALYAVEPLLDAIAKGEVVPPKKFDFGWIFFRGDNELLTYPEIANMVAMFADALEDREVGTGFLF